MSTVKITAKPTLDNNVYEFVLDRQLLLNGHILCRDQQQTADSPLLQALMALPSIEQILVAGQTLTIRKTKLSLWPKLALEVGKVIRQVIAEASILFPINAEEFAKQQAVNAAEQQPVEIAEMQRIVDAVLNPQVAQHGGHISIKAIEGQTVHVLMSGGCQGCSQSSVTLKNGVEQVIKQHFPSITAVVDATEHASGTNPYY